jgi:ABC-2 type transport system permease protein
MRALLFMREFRADYLVTAAALDAVWLVLGAAAFFWALWDARRRGALLQMGE